MAERMLTCECCFGTGKVIEDDKLNKARAVRVARFLRSEGISIRKIMRLMDYKSPRSVQDLLENSDGTKASIWPAEEKCKDVSVTGSY